MQFCRATVNQLSSKHCMYAYMNTKNPFYDPSVWRNRAAQTRAKADNLRASAIKGAAA
jgi:hypothetical protein